MQRLMVQILNRIRLTYFFAIFVAFYLIISLLVDGIPLDRPALTLFSVNAFLYGFYISPIVSFQRDRLRGLHRLISNEASRLYEINQYTLRLEPDFRKGLQKELKSYTDAAYATREEQGEKEFEQMMKVAIEYKGDTGEYKEMLKSIFAIQANRAEINRLLHSPVYKNEWIVLSILFIVTVVFILAIQLPSGSLLNLVPPILCAGITTLYVILLKMSTLTHKRAKTIWEPLDKLSSSDFADIRD